MNEFALLGKNLAFSDAAMQSWNNLQYMSEVIRASENQFLMWYKEQDDIRDVIDGYPEFASGIVVDFVLNPSHNGLPHLGIFDVSKRAYNEACIDYSGIEAAHEAALGEYNEILSNAEMMRSYRAMRKDLRAKFIGGGFGVGGAIKGAITAGALNAVTGAFHGVRNAVGNVGTAVSEKHALKSLYEGDHIAEIMWEGLERSLLACNVLHCELVNSKIPGTIEDSFDSERAEALFENAKRFPDKKAELLVEAFQACPYDLDMLFYAFISFPDERHNLLVLAKAFGLDCDGIVEAWIQFSYQERNETKGYSAEENKAIIKNQMKEFGLNASDTLNEVEQIELKEILSGYLPNCASNITILGRIRDFEGESENKAAVIKACKVWQLSKEYNVFFDVNEVEEIICAIWSTGSKASFEQLLQTKTSVQQVIDEIILPKEFSPDNSDTLIEIDTTLLKSLCADINSLTDEKQCISLIENVKAFPVLKRLQKEYLEKIEKRISVLKDAQNENEEIVTIASAAINNMCVSELNSFATRVWKSSLPEIEKKRINTIIDKRKDEVPEILEHTKNILRMICRTITDQYSLGYVYVISGCENFDRLYPNAHGAYVYQEICAEEIPLVLYDDSMFSNGKAGFVITNKKLYAKPLLEKPFVLKLEDIIGFEENGKELSVRGIEKSFILSRQSAVAETQQRAKCLEALIKIISKTTFEEVEKQYADAIKNPSPKDNGIVDAMKPTTEQQEGNTEVTTKPYPAEKTEEMATKVINHNVVASLVEKYNLGVRYLVDGTSAFLKKIVKAKTNFASLEPDEVAYLVEDQTLFGSVKEGMVLTNRAVYLSRNGVKLRIRIADIKAVETYFESMLKMYEINLQYASNLTSGELTSVMVSYCSGEEDMKRLRSFWLELLFE